MDFGSARHDFESVILKTVRDKIRNGKIKLLKTYIQVVGGVRMITMAVAGLSATVSVFVVGLLLAIIGLIGLIPVSIQTFFIIIASIGVVLMIVSSVLLVGFFDQKIWLKHARVSELVEMVLEDAQKKTDVAPAATDQSKFI